MEENKEIFTYTYSARQQEEVQAHPPKIHAAPEDKMELLRRLDKSAQQPGTIAGHRARRMRYADARAGHVLYHGVDRCFRPGRGRRLHRASPCWRWLIRCFCI